MNWKLIDVALLCILVWCGVYLLLLGAYSVWPA
jgi:hypothetical protein